MNVTHDMELWTLIANASFVVKGVMALLLAVLVLRDRRPGGLPAPLVDGTLERTGKGLLAHLSLLFVPAGAGVIGRLDVLAAHGVALAVALVVSTALALVATVLTFAYVARRTGR